MKTAVLLMVMLVALLVGCASENFKPLGTVLFYVQSGENGRLPIHLSVAYHLASQHTPVRRPIPFQHEETKNPGALCFGVSQHLSAVMSTTFR